MGQTSQARARFPNSLSTVSTSPNAPPGSILFEHTSHIRTIACTCFIVMTLPNLKRLTLEIEVRVSDESSEHDALTRLVSKADLKSLPLFRSLAKHLGLQHITAVSASNGSFVWLQNVAALERIVNLTLKETAPERDQRRVKADKDRQRYAAFLASPTNRTSMDGRYSP
ncbi:hypothetical protein LTR86_004917 [Recurvomyces mirabilis]|nr:hypothetical protein LTR86_004917 [Recurvomyces mirabilis]